MNRSRGTVAGAFLLPVVAAATTWVAFYAWHGFAEEPGGYLNPLLLLAVVVGGTGIALRWWRVPGPLVVLVQVLASGVVAMLLITGSPLPVDDGWIELHRALTQALESAQQFAAPVPTRAPPLDALMILCGLACLLLVDLLACTWRKVPLAGLPLLTIYSIPVSLVGSQLSWWVFAATAAGYLTMLFLSESDAVRRWGRPIGLDRETGDPIAYGAGAHAVRSTAGTVGGVATALAIFLPALIPTAGLHVFDFGPGSGGSDDITIDNPTADLVRDFKAGDDSPLVRVTTNDPDPSYLRIVALTRFTDVEWSPGDRDVPADQGAVGTLPPPQGVDPDTPRSETAYDITVLPAFRSTWLPTATVASRVVADGDWRYDDDTMDFLAVPDDLTTSGMRYSMTEVDLELSADRLRTSVTPSGRVSEIFTDIPDDLPPVVRELAVEVTGSEQTEFEKAVALQNWFREEFDYSLDQVEGSGYDALEQFLGEDENGENGRTGYCEQFASAMAIMARVLGIPARVAIGFLSPTQTGPSSYVYTARDLHAWPELYFDGAGWVRFEPTPAGRSGDAPSYTRIGQGPDDDPTESTEPSAGESSLLPNNRPLVEPTDAGTGDFAGSGGSNGRWYVAGGAVLAVLLVVGALLPRTLRRRRRAHRLGSGDPELAWAELRDTAVDLGIPWPEGRSPRATRHRLVQHLGTSVGPQTDERPAHGAAIAPEAVESLDRIVHELELQRYARPGSASTADHDAARSDTRAHTRAVLAALAGGAAGSARRRASWWPRSVLTLRRRTRRTAPTTVETPYGGIVDHAS
ncbi:transglutaminase family protein [Nocardioides pyridinolyticus]